MREKDESHGAMEEWEELDQWCHVREAPEWWRKRVVMVSRFGVIIGFAYLTGLHEWNAGTPYTSEVWHGYNCQGKRVSSGQSLKGVKKSLRLRVKKYGAA